MDTTWLAFILQVMLLFVGLFLIGIILLQRGRGGGLAGAFGGTGGQSAFGAKAGDIFTWITVGAAAIWVLLAGIGGCVMRQSESQFAKENLPQAELVAPTDNTTSDDSLIPESPAGSMTPEAGSTSGTAAPAATETAPKADSMPAAAPKTETPPAETPKPETPKPAEPSKPEPAKPEAEKADAPKADAPKTESPAPAEKAPEKPADAPKEEKPAAEETQPAPATEKQ